LTTECVEFTNNAPGIGADGAGNEPVPSATGFISDPGYLNYRITFYWDKRAWSLYQGDYTKGTMSAR